MHGADTEDNRAGGVSVGDGYSVCVAIRHEKPDVESVLGAGRTFAVVGPGVPVAVQAGSAAFQGVVFALSGRRVICMEAFGTTAEDCRASMVAAC